MAGSPNLGSIFSNRVVRIVAVIAVLALAAGAVFVYGPFHANPRTAAMPSPAAPNATSGNGAANPAGPPANPKDVANVAPAAGPPAPVATNPGGPAGAAKAASAKGNALAANAAVRKGGVTVHAAAVEPAGAPVVTAVPDAAQKPGSSLAHLDEQLTYQYNALGRRDPFQSLVDGSFVGADVGGDAPPDPGGIKVVGIVWGSTDQFALVEDVRGNSFVLRKGDKVQNGYVEGLKRDGLIVNITSEGQSQSVVIPLVRKGDQNAR